MSDGRGGWRICAVTHGGLAASGAPGRDPAPATARLYLCPIKGERAEWAVAKATELGVSHVVPLVSRRLAVRFGGDARAKTLARWRRVAAEAAGQCRRTHDLVIEDPVGVGDVPGDVAVCDPSGSPRWEGVRAVAIGPEGGWASEDWAPDRRRLSLGPTVLRSETAAVVAASLIVFANADWGFSLGEGTMGKDEGTK